MSHSDDVSFGAALLAVLTVCVAALFAALFTALGWVGLAVPAFVVALTYSIYRFWLWMLTK